jgi:hypothetical protein
MAFEVVAGFLRRGPAHNRPLSSETGKKGKDAPTTHFCSREGESAARSGGKERTNVIIVFL